MERCYYCTDKENCVAKSLEDKMEKKQREYISDFLELKRKSMVLYGGKEDLYNVFLQMLQ